MATVSKSKDCYRLSNHRPILYHVTCFCPMSFTEIKNVIADTQSEAVRLIPYKLVFCRGLSLYMLFRGERNVGILIMLLDVYLGHFFRYLVSEYHLHQNVMKGHVCVVGDRTTLNSQIPDQRYELLILTCRAVKRLTGADLENPEKGGRRNCGESASPHPLSHGKIHICGDSALQ